MLEKVADKCIVRPWEELRFKRNRYGLGYVQDADNLFHFPNYSEPVCFVSVGFLNDDKTTEHIGKEQVQDIADDDVTGYSLKYLSQSKRVVAGRLIKALWMTIRATSNHQILSIVIGPT